MADSIPSLRRKLAEANARIRELESRPVSDRIVEKRVDVPVYKERVVTKPVEVQGPDVIHTVTERVEVKGQERIIYVTDPAQEDMIHKLQEKLRCISQSD